MSSLTVAINLPFKPEPVDIDVDLYADLESDRVVQDAPGKCKGVRTEQPASPRISPHVSR